MFKSKARLYSFSMVSALLLALVAFAFVAGGDRLWAAITANGDVPELMSYQGYLEDSSGEPLNSSVDLTFAIYDASTGGNKVWEETHTGVSMNEGFFSVQLGAGTVPTPLTSSVFDGATRYLQVQVASDPPLPRQRIASVPYALQADVAGSATTAISSTYTLSATQALSSTYATTATYAMSAPSSEGYAQVVTVAKSGGDYTSVAAALDSISDASSSKPYLVWVAPGIFVETDLVNVKPYVHLEGSGRETTQVISERSSTVQNSDSATAQLQNQGRISNLTIRNAGTTSIYAIGIVMFDDVTRAAVLDNVKVLVNGTGGTGHFAVYLADAEPTIQRSWLAARGATLVNAAAGSTNANGGGFPQALIEQSVLLGGDTNDEFCADNSGSGYGLFLNESAPTVRDSYICGGHRAIAATVNGQTRVHRSILSVSGTIGAFLFEINGGSAIVVAGSQVNYNLNKITGAAAVNLVCVHSYKGNHAPATDAAGLTACD